MRRHPWLLTIPCLILVCSGVACSGDDGEPNEPDTPDPTEEFHVNTYTTGSQRNPRVASDAAGNFVVIWDGGDRLDSGI